MSQHPHILVVGAGVIGLTTAFQLFQKYGSTIQIEVIAKDLPGENDILYTSPKAGAHWVSTHSSKNDKKLQKWHAESYTKFMKLSELNEAWIKPMDLYVGVIATNNDESTTVEEPWYKDHVVGYEYLTQDPVKFPGVSGLYKFKSFTISTTNYLIYLMNELVKSDVKITRKSIDSLSDTQSYNFQDGSTPDFIINCTGLQFNFLKDGGDPNLYPIRGHTLIVENELPYQVNFDIEDPVEDGEFLMCFPRKEGGAVLGGIYDEHSPAYDSTVHDDYVERLIARTKKHLPELGDVKLIRHNLGFRPGRRGGPRIELDKFNKKIIHNYGCGSLGYIESWGCADEVIKILNKQLNKSKL